MKILSRGTIEKVPSRNSIHNKPQKNKDYEDLFLYLKKLDFPKSKPIITIILPVYNEERTIRQILEQLPNHPLIEILVIDDHSTDSSLEEIKKAWKNRKIRVIKHPKNRGYGEAITTGLQNAEGHVMITMDSDGQHDSEDLFDLVKPILDNKADLTIGSRYLGSYHYSLPLLTRLGELLTEKLIRMFFRVKVLNNQSGFRAFNKRAVSTFNNKRFYGYAFCTEQILCSSISECNVKEIPIKVFGREHGTSKVNVFILGFDIVSCLLIYYLKKLRKVLWNKNRKKFSDLF